MNEINLISKKKEDLLRKKKIINGLRIISVVFLSLIVLSSIVVFFLRFTSPLDSLKKEESKLLTEISSSKQKMAKLLVASEKLKSISEIISQRPNFDKTIDTVLKEAPQNLQVSSLTIDKKNVVLTVSSQSLFSINTFMDNLINLYLNKKIFEKITLNNLSADQVLGKYSLTIEGNLL